MKANVVCWMLLGCLAASVVRGQPANPYSALAKTLAGQIKEGSLSVGVGNFLYEDTDLTSPYSALLRKEMEQALHETGKFQVVARERLGELQNEGKFQDVMQGMRAAGRDPIMRGQGFTAKNLLDPGTLMRGDVTIKDVQGLVRGRFFYQFPEVRVAAELVWLNGGQMLTAVVTIPASEVAARILPPGLGPNNRVQPSSVFIPTNVLDLTNVIKLPQVMHDFEVNLLVNESKKGFMEGETISFRVWTQEVDCHIAVVDLRPDGSNVLLFPNKWNRNSWITAGQKIDIPGEGNSDWQFIIREPFGMEMVQVIACVDSNRLHRLVEQIVNPRRGISAEPSKVDPRSKEWSEAHRVVCTYPAVKQ